MKKHIFNTSEQESSKSCLICLEIGCGSGFVSASLNQSLNEANIDCFQFLTDINENAAKIAFKTMEKNIKIVKYFDFEEKEKKL